MPVSGQSKITYRLCSYGIIFIFFSFSFQKLERSKYASLYFCILFDFCRRIRNLGDGIHPFRLLILSFFDSFFFLSFFWQVVLVEGWHDLDNKDYDCWPLEKPDEHNMLDCGGEWVIKKTWYLTWGMAETPKLKCS